MGFKAVLSLITFGLGTILLTGCANTSALEVTRALFGYIEPPKAESVMTSLRKEYHRCMKIDDSRDCVQIAYNIVRKDQGLDPKPIPKGYVIVTQQAMEEVEPEPQNNESDSDQEESDEKENELQPR